MGEKCLFCEIAQGRLKAFVVYEDEHATAFLDLRPRVEGHTLVVSKTHAPTLADLPESAVGPLFLAVQRAARLVGSALQADGLTIGINQGAVSGQTVEHLHVHIFPRFRNDGGGSVHSIVESPSKRNIEEVHKKILAARE